MVENDSWNGRYHKYCKITISYESKAQSTVAFLKFLVPAMVLIPTWLIVKLNDDFKSKRFARLIKIKKDIQRTSTLI